MKRCFWGLTIILLIAACKGKKGSLQDDDAITVKDFIEFFPEVSPPVTVADTTLLKKQTDSMLISYKVFTQFVPDSVLIKDFGKGVTPKLYPLGRLVEKGKETYLFIKATHGNKRVGYLACFSNTDTFMQAMPLVKTGFDNSTAAYGMLDKKFQITTYRERRQAKEGLNFKKNVYIFSPDAGGFTLIFTEPNQEIIENVINPIDTFPAKSKFSGDYMRDKKNFIAIRDGRNPVEFLFFVHFEKENGDCTGELKGTARFVSAGKAVYQAAGNPCTLEFIISGSRITMKETGGCGTYRDIKCFFEGSFTRRKAPAKAPGKK